MALEAALDDHVDEQVQEALDVAAREAPSAAALLDEQHQLLERQLGAGRVHAGDGSRMTRVDVTQVIERLLGAQLGEQDAIGPHPQAAFEQLLRCHAREALVVLAVEQAHVVWMVIEHELARVLITIEDARELVLDDHPNHVRLFYSKDDQGLARVTPKQLLECCLRMRPDRILLAELRSEEAFDYLRNVNSGHPGSITSVHATSAELAFEQLVLLVKQSRGGRSLARRDIKSLLYLLIDVIIQCGLECHQRVIREVWFDPSRKRRAARGPIGRGPTREGVSCPQPA